MHWYWDGGAHMAWMGVWWVLGAVVIAALVWAVLAPSARGSGSRGDSPERILKRRYARGEIDHDTYERMLSELRG
jgi:putative membrane protein